MMIVNSTEYYRKNPRARRKKARTDAAINRRPEQVRKRVESNRARRRAKRNGRNVTGLDASHTKNGMVFKSIRRNRGSKKDSSGDRNARG